MLLIYMNFSRIQKSNEYDSISSSLFEKETLREREGKNLFARFDIDSS